MDICPSGYQCPSTANCVAPLSCTAGNIAMCAAGQYQPTEGMTSCIACPAGSFCQLAGAVTPLLCAINTFTATTGLTVCATCGAGTYAIDYGATGCRPDVSTSTTITIYTRMVSGAPAPPAFPSLLTTALPNSLRQALWTSLSAGTFFVTFTAACNQELVFHRLPPPISPAPASLTILCE
jgi:hypothetical protein